jgi:hypothetical protein
VNVLFFSIDAGFAHSRGSIKRLWSARPIKVLVFPRCSADCAIFRQIEVEVATHKPISHFQASDWIDPRSWRNAA